jgi:formylglycine-generating enzyme required for sulfatase activity
MGKPEIASQCLENIQDAAMQGAMTAIFAKCNLSTDWLIEQLFDEKVNVALRRQCGLALSLYQSKSDRLRLKSELDTRLPDLYPSVTDPGLRSAVESLATNANVALGSEPSGFSSLELTSWAGDRLVIVRPSNPTWMGSHSGEPGRDHSKERWVAISLQNDFAIATREVTVDQYQRFNPNHNYPKNYANTTDCPVINVSLIDAARYCRWLSEQDGISESEMCYPPLDEIKSGMLLADGFDKRTGYRLPTEAEWEYACRGQAEPGRWFGFDPEILENYAWTTQNSDYRMQPVGTRLPNHFGLFDMLGNGMEWCGTEFKTYSSVMKEPQSDPGCRSRTIGDDVLMTNRGGANLYQPLDARASQRNYHYSNAARVYITFRIARTIRDED